MADWISIAHWSRSAGLARPGGAFEFKSRDGRLVAGEWSAVAPPLPPGWTAPLTHFRCIPAPAPRHSTPIPPPVGGS